MDQFSRTKMLLGDNAEKLKSAHVAVFGIGGVGSYTAEALARAGVGALTLVDNDTVSVSNINRQLIALHSTVGKLKTSVCADRVRDINPDISVFEKAVFFGAETEDEIDFSGFDYVVDAIDTVTSKILIAKICQEKSVPVISCMGTGNKLDPTKFCVADISKTAVCPLARAMRQNLKKAGVKKLKVLYSTEAPLTPQVREDTELKGNSGRVCPGSVSFVPSVAGLIIAGEVIKDICGV